jgi:hypothetical protein
VNAAVNTAAAAVPGAIAGSSTSTAPAGIDPVAATGPAAASLQPADGAVPVNPATSAQTVEEMVAKEVARRERLAAQQEAARKKRQAAAAAAANNDDDETVSDDDGGGATTTDARALRKAYLCRTQHRC